MNIHHLSENKNVAELEHALLPHDPLCRFERAPVRTLRARPRHMPQRDCVGRRIEADLVGTRMPSSTRFELTSIFRGYPAAFISSTSLIMVPDGASFLVS